MKTVKKRNKLPRRVSDAMAEEMVKQQGWKYCPKGEWREKVRDAKPVEKKVSKKNGRQTSN